MIKINLLPWREERKILALNRYIAILIITAIITLILILVARAIVVSSSQLYSYYDEAKLRQSVDILKNQISQMKTYEKQYQELNKFTGIIDEMYVSPIILLETLKQIPNLIPDTVKVKTGVFDGQVYILDGQTVSQKETFRFMENLKTLKFVNDVQLQDFNQSGISGANFRLKIYVTYKDKS